jgi:hypothetical protein
MGIGTMYIYEAMMGGGTRCGACAPTIVAGLYESAGTTGIDLRSDSPWAYVQSSLFLQ